MKIPEKTFEEKVKQEMNRCIHFNGIMHSECKSGINYYELMGSDPECFAHMPCFNDEHSTVVCSKRQFLSREEAEKDVTESDARIAKFIEELNQSICSICKVQVKQRQVGRCVYGTCGHRLYQGTVTPEHAEDPTKIPCRCNCPKSCEHKWDGPGVDLYEGGNSVTCSNCGMTAIDHDMMVM